MINCKDVNILSNPNFTLEEQKILEFWKHNNIFNKTIFNKTVKDYIYKKCIQHKIKNACFLGYITDEILFNLLKFEFNNIDHIKFVLMPVIKKIHLIDEDLVVVYEWLEKCEELQDDFLYYYKIAKPFIHFCIVQPIKKNFKKFFY